MALQTDVPAILDRGVSAGDVVGAVAQAVTGDGLLAAVPPSPARGCRRGFG